MLAAALTLPLLMSLPSSDPDYLPEVGGTAFLNENNFIARDLEALGKLRACVKGQDAKEVKRLIEAHVVAILPTGTKVRVLEVRDCPTSTVDKDVLVRILEGVGKDDSAWTLRFALSPKRPKP